MEYYRNSIGLYSTPPKPRKMPAKRQVLGLRISSDSNQGGRDHMEDMIAIRYERRADHDCVFFGVFDGHGGKEAAVFARDLLWDNIKSQRGFESKDPDKVKQAIHEGFMKTQEGMWKKRSNWGTTKSGYPSTSGTTACIAIVRAREMWIANVGDSRAVMGVLGPNGGGLKSRTATIDHKPESPREIRRIEAIGGKVQAKNGVKRVVWERTKLSHSGPVRRSTSVDQIPFLAVARSLGDLWSYSTLHNDYIVSPKPDINHYVLDPKVHQCLVIGSDGLWNMLSSSDAIYILSKYYAEKKQGTKLRETMAQRLVKNSINRWVLRSLRADNTTAITVVFDFPKEKPKPAEVKSKPEKSTEGETPTSSSATKVETDSPSTSKDDMSTPDKPAGEVTDSEPKKEEEPVGSKLRIRGETDFVGVQGFGSFRPKLRHSNMYRDFVFRFHYPEPEEKKWPFESWGQKRKANEDEDDSDCEDYWQTKRWKPDGETYINTPVVEVTNSKISKRRPSYTSPWVSPEDVAPPRRKGMISPRKCGNCYECRIGMPSLCSKKPKVEIIREYKLDPNYKEDEDKEDEEEDDDEDEDEGDCGCYECLKGRPEFCYEKEEESDPILYNEVVSPNCRCYVWKNGKSVLCTPTNISKKPRQPKKKVGKDFKQSRYNTRNSPTEPEVPLAQRALRSLNKSATQSSKPKNLYTPAKRQTTRRRRSNIKSC